MALTTVPAAAASLGRVDLFAPLTADELETLSAAVRRRRYPKGTVVFLEGDPGVSLYVVESGRVKIVLSSPDGREVVIAVRGPGEFFGDMALLDGEPRSADAVAVAECWLLILPREDFARFLDTHPHVALRLLALLSRRLRQTMRRQQEATLLDVAARLATALLRLAEERRAVPTGVDANAEGADDRHNDAGTAMVIEAPPTQAELAAHIGTTRESVNKWLRYFERRGVVRRGAGTLVILRPDSLRDRLT